MDTAKTKRLRTQIKDLEEARNIIEKCLVNLKVEAGLDPRTNYAEWIDKEGNLINFGD